MKVTDAIVLDKNRITLDIDLLTVALVHNVDPVEIAKIEAKLVALKQVLYYGQPLDDIVRNSYDQGRSDINRCNLEDYIKTLEI